MFFYAASWYVYIKKVHTFYTLFWEKLGNNIIPLVICGEAVCSALVTVAALLFQVAGLDAGFTHSSFVPFHTQKTFRHSLYSHWLGPFQSVLYIVMALFHFRLWYHQKPPLMVMIVPIIIIFPLSYHYYYTYRKQNKGNGYVETQSEQKRRESTHSSRIPLLCVLMIESEFRRRERFHQWVKWGKGDRQKRNTFRNGLCITLWNRLMSVVSVWYFGFREDNLRR